MSSKVYMAIQAIDESYPIIEAIEIDNPGVSIENLSAMIKITADDKIVIKAQTVSEILGREWDVQELQLVMISLTGNVEEDYDHFTIFWDK